MSQALETVLKLEAASHQPTSKPAPLRCTRCLYNETVSQITFDANGVCNYCQLHDEMEAQYPNGVEGQRLLEKMVADIKEAGRGRKYDCVIGVSGGCDSSFLIYKMVDMGLRPLAVHFDNTWNSPIATQNIYNVLDKLKVDLFTHVVNNREYDDIVRAFMLSGLKDIECPTDMGITTTLYMAAEKYGIRYMIDGHSFRTEGISPLGWLYWDGKFVDSVHKRYGKMHRKTFPNLPLHRFLKWTLLTDLKRVRPLYYMDYRKEEVKKFLNENFDWEWYGGHHLENRLTSFYHTYFLPRKARLDTRLLGHSALVRSGQLERASALDMLALPQQCPEEIIDLFKKRLGFSDAEFEQVMNLRTPHYGEFKTYKKTFERLRPLFWALYKSGKVTKSFYLKYCFPSPQHGT